MANILKFIIQAVAALWPLLKKYKKTSTAVAATGVTAAMFYGSGGVTNPPPAVPMGAVTNHPGSDGDALTSNGDYTYTWEAGGGGGGLTYDGTITDGQFGVYDDTANEYIPTLAGAPVYSVKNPIAYTPPGGGSARMVRAAGTNLQTTGTITAASTSLSVTSATGWARGYGIYLPGAGAAHGLSTPSAPNVTPQGTSGATSRDYRIRALSGDGGCTDTGTITTITTGNATLSTTNFDFITWPTVTGAKAYAIYGDSTTDANQYLLTIVQGQPTALAIQFDAANYISAVAADIGRTVVQGSHDGVLLGFDNTARIWWVDPTVWGTDTFNGSGSAVTTTVSTSGTSTGASATTLTLAAGASAVNDTYNGQTIYITSGTGLGTYAVITDYDGPSRVATVASWTGTQPVSGDDYRVTVGTGQGTQTSAATNACYWKNCGAAATTVPFKQLGRRNSANTYVGELMLYPLSTSGVLYRCVRTVKDGATASSAPSFSTTLGAETADGDVVWRRENQCVPVLPTTSGWANALTTHVTDISGTTLTLADAATTSTSGQFVMHDDLSAAQAWHAASIASTAQSAILHWPAGDYDLRPGTPLDDGAGNDARYNVIANGGNDYLFTLFDMSNSGRSGKEVEWHAHGASVWYAASDTAARLRDDSANAATADNRWFVNLGTSAVTFRGGRYIYAPSGTTPMEHGDAWNWMFFSGDDPTNDAARGPRFYGVSLLAWPRLTIHTADYGPGREEVWDDCDLTYGGAGHDGGWYLAGGRIRGCTNIGIRFDRSLGIYQDDNTYETSLWIHDCTFKNFLQNGIRVRMDGFYFTKNRCFDFENFIDSPGGDEAYFAFNRFERVNIDLGDMTDLQFVHNTVVDSTVTLSATSLICNFNRIRATASFAPTTTTTMVQLAGAAQGGEYIGNNLDVTAYTPGQSVRDLLISGSGSWKVAKNHHRVESVFTFRITCTGNVLIEKNDIGTTFTAANSLTPCAGNGTYTLRDNTWTTGAANTPLQIDAGVRVTIDGDRCTTGHMTVAAISGPCEIRNMNLPSATASTFAHTGTRLIENNFAVAPTLSVACYTRGNMVAGSAISSPTALNSGTTNNYQLPVTDYVRLDPNASNSTLSGLVAFTGGTEKVLLNADAAAAQVILDDSGGGSSAANQFAFGATTLDTNDLATIWYDSTASLWMLKSVTP